MSKLTLSIDDTVIQRAKRYARLRKVSVSRLVEDYLDVLAEPPRSAGEPPVLRALRGVLKKANPEDHKRHLARKYR